MSLERSVFVVRASNRIAIFSSLQLQPRWLLRLVAHITLFHLDLRRRKEVLTLHWTAIIQNEILMFYQRRISAQLRCRMWAETVQSAGNSPTDGRLCRGVSTQEVVAINCRPSFLRGISGLSFHFPRQIMFRNSLEGRPRAMKVIVSKE